MFLLDLIAHISTAHAHAVLFSDSSGGRSAAEFKITLNPKPSCVFFNDAGGGKDNAGKVALDILQAHGVPYVCYSHMSARIGDVQDSYEQGIVSGLNQLARDKDIELNMTAKESVKSC